MSEKRKTIDLSDNCRVCLGKNDRMADLYFSNTLKKINEAVNNSATIHVRIYYPSKIHNRDLL